MTSNGDDRTWYSESLARGLRVIQAFDRATPRLRMAEVARRAGLTRAAARRYLLTLQDLGYVASEGDMFHLRPRLLSLGFSYLSSINVEQLVQPVLNELAERTGASSTFAVLDAHDVVSVARAPSKGIFMLANSIGGRLPAHATSLGQVLLAGLSADDLERYLDESKRVACTKSTTIESDRLRRRLKRVRAEGLALVNGEYAEGLVAVAIPVSNSKGKVVAAININFYPASAAKVTLAKKHIPTLRTAAREIETAIRTHAYFS